MHTYRIKAQDANGSTVEYLKFAQFVMAEMAFYALTHDAANQDVDWLLEVQDKNDKQWVLVNWHYPRKTIKQEDGAPLMFVELTNLAPSGTPQL